MTRKTQTPDALDQLRVELENATDAEALIIQFKGVPVRGAHGVLKRWPEDKFRGLQWQRAELHAHRVTVIRPAKGQAHVVSQSPIGLLAFYRVVCQHNPELLFDEDAGARAATLLLAQVELEESHQASPSTSKPLWWEPHVGALVGTKQAKLRLGVKTRNGVNSLVRTGKLLALRGPGARTLRYPESQFDPNTGRPWADLPKVLSLLRSARISDPEIAGWLVSPQSELDDLSPQQWLTARRDPEWVVTVARRTAADLVS